MSASSVLDRTCVLTTCAECAELVDRLRRSAHPVGVDLEGIHLEKVALVQIKTYQNNIYLVRTAKEDMFGEGRLKELFEDSTIVKVMHASRADSAALHKLGVRLLNVFDTSVAHKVIQYQNSGEPLGNARDIGFNSLCKKFGAEANPVKETMKEDLWKRAKEFVDADPLPADLTLYSACDVDPLYPNLYETTKGAIERDFIKHFEELSEIESLRNVDPELAKLRVKARVEWDLCDVFVRDLPSNVIKFDVYQAISSQPGIKWIDFAEKNRTAHITVKNRNSADQLCRALKQRENFQTATLVIQMKEEEITLTKEQMQNFVQELRKQNYVLAADKIRQFVSFLLETKMPVALDFVCKDGNVLLEAYFGQSEKLRFHLCPESIVDGKLGDLFAASDVVKIVDGIENHPGFHSAVRLLVANKVTSIKNVFDLSSAFKIYEFWQKGHAFFAATTIKLTDHLKNIGFGNEACMEKRLLCFMELITILPEAVLNILGERTAVEVDLLVRPQDSKPREKRKELRTKLETKGVHIALKRNCYQSFQLIPALHNYQQYIKKMEIINIVPLTNTEVIVEVKAQWMVMALVNRIRKEHFHQYINGDTCWANPVEVPKKTTHLLKLGQINVEARRGQVQQIVQKHDDKWKRVMSMPQ